MSKRKKANRLFWVTAGDLVENAVTHNVVLAQALGLCPIIAVGVNLQSGVVLTVCTALVMIPLSLVISFVGKHLAKWVRPALYVLLATFLMMGAGYVLDNYISTKLYAQLYLFIPLIAVNMIYSRSIGFASTVKPLETVIDAVGSTLGFGLVICLISALREIAISGTLWGKPLSSTALVLPEAAAPFTAFILLGFMAALLQWARQHITAYFRRKEEEHQ
ncbi:MAG: hypothetical protein E7541_06915 [Ruminococcaceae bacterium]|nr:hypothetical protein [Oscillospiraceae bacterium]